MQKDGLLPDVLIKAALEILGGGPWLHLRASPEWKTIQPLSVKWPLRGADLWHLPTAKSLQEQIPALSCCDRFSIRFLFWSFLKISR